MADTNTLDPALRRAAVITVSDRSARGERKDESGPRAVGLLRAAGYRTDDAQVVPDGRDSVHDALRAAIDAGARLVITTGGTGVGPRDLTPEGTRPLLERELPGIAEALRREGAIHSKHAVLSRGLAGVTAAPAFALVINLPGSLRAVEQGMEVVLPLVAHILDQLDGADHG